MMRFGFFTGSISRIGSGRTEAVPLARALSKLGCDVVGLETTRFRHSRTTVENLDVYFEPVAPYLIPRSFQIIQALLKRGANGKSTPGLLNQATGDALLRLADNLKLDVVYAFHNTSVSRLLKGWPHPSRLLVINLIGFGIDPSRGGSADTFPLQKYIFEHPYWDLHITATKFEYEQYYQVYQQLGIDPQKLLHLPHSYDEELFRPAGHDAGSNENSVSGSKVILYPVNVYPRKNIEFAIETLAILNRHAEYRLIITGKIWDPAYRDRMITHAHEHGVAEKVEFLGGVSIEKLLQYYHLSDVIIYTSHQETFGHGIVEALGCGKPVVGPDWIIPCREILSEAPGGWAAPKDPHEFAAAVLHAFDVPHDSTTLASFAQDRYGNMAVAARFLQRCHEINSAKDLYGSKLRTINWKGLYQDAGDLL